jgi:hypothetical protein
MTPQQVAVRVLVALLVAGDYDVAAAMTRNDRLSAEELRNAIARYGRTLVPLPEDQWDRLDVVAIDGREHPTFHVVLDLWTAEEGRSDLSLELELTDRYGGAFETRILDLHVL